MKKCFSYQQEVIVTLTNGTDQKMAVEPACLTCTKGTSPDLAVTVGNQEEVQGALSKHFWFSEYEYRDSLLCQYCWNQIKEFNRFYCEIEQVHSNKKQDTFSNFVEIKQEPGVCEEEEGGGGFVKREHELKEEVEPFEDDCNSFEQEVDPDSDKDSSEDEDIVSHEEAVDSFIKENIKFKCATCSKEFGRFEELRRHSLVQHGKRAYAFCCGNRYSQKSKLTAHVLFHVNPARLQCDLCAKQFRTRRAWKNHRETAHATEEEKVLQCSVCPKKFAREQHLKQHEKYHRKLKERKWHCARCDKYFPYESTLRQHNRSIHSIDELAKVEGKEGCLKTEADDHDNEVETDKAEDYLAKLKKRTIDNELIAQHITLECDTCSKKFETFEILQKHSTTVHFKRATVSCCDTGYSHKPTLVDHIRFHVDPAQLQCEKCSKQFRQLRALKFHLETAHASEEAAVLQCPMCPKKFSTEKHLKIHQKYHLRLSERKWYCEACDRYFAYESILRQHNKSIHTKDSLYVCHICAKEYHIYSSYTSHVATHDETGQAKNKPPEEKLQCPECGTWVAKRGLRRHILRHSGSQTCDQCGHECRSAMALRYHQAQHRSGDFGCTLCTKTFKAQLTLKEHMATHTGEVLYSCDFCEKTFNSHANRASHRKKMHPKEWLEDKMRKKSGGVTNALQTEQQISESVGAFGFETECFYGILCPVCWTKLRDFHHFYTEVENIHAKHLQFSLQLQPEQLLEVKQEPGPAAVVFVAEDVDVKSEAEGEESNDGSKIESDVDNFGGEGCSPKPGEYSDGEVNETSQDDSDYEEDEPAPKRGRKPGSGKKKQIKRTGRRVGRPVQGWQKDIKDESFIAETVNLVCDTCSEKFETFEDLQKHSTALHDKLAYIFCCNLKFSRKPRLVDHIQFHLNPSQFACKLCPKKQFGDREALKRHMRSMHVDEEEKTMQCSVCPKRFAQKRFLNLHEKYHRNLQEKKFHCVPCNRYFAYASLLRHHNEEVHENKPDKYVCHVCAKSYNIYTSYKSHVDSHDEEAKKVKQLSMERVQCSDCNAWVYQRGLRKHMLRHSGTQRCDICGQECSSVMTLKYHKAQHRKDDLTCSVCEKVFKRMINFKEHMASHTGDVLYSCDFCDKTFNSNANRASHRKKMHPKEWLEDKIKKNPNLIQEQFQQQPQQQQQAGSLQ